MKPLNSSMGIIPNLQLTINDCTLFDLWNNFVQKRYGKISLEFMKNVYDLLLFSDWFGKTE